ncbi:SGNH/GDSL hydrolase family protein [Aeromicrobium wangtongii]|uniref:SGNH/GDSL hydrolase family protein n=1 Tax=Aeromicrobium wangtongii TaxID=2969247 RepID=A0ABY5MDW9_9ACTN|nr:SGNH/GDSL hydrolase family protein [Aeromicrobium wangtongii]MCD9197951.1 SGNH/GDSL hydrolase family protein [Aeromicrobium wangtongii]UUP15429.1 SGNH/GDSL hydrolase family protein [Aeromicrobium wangtongii]
MTAGLAVTALAMTMTMTTTAANAAIDVYDNGPGGERYVAMGDSVAAGPILLPQRPGGSPCFRSEKNFATQTAAAIGARKFTDATCSSATIDNITTPQGSEPPQIDAVDKNTTLVTVGPIGANDVGIVSTVSGCISVVAPGCKERDGQTVHNKIEATRAELATALAAIKKKAPRAAVVVVGYGLYIPPAGCPLVQPLTSSDADYIQGLVDHMSNVLRDSARAAGATFADLRATPGSMDHTACAAPGQRWIEGLVPASADGAIPFHPTALGMQAVAPTVTAAARRAAAERNTRIVKDVRGEAVCRGSKVRLRVLTKGGPVVRTDFKVGNKFLGRDSSAPFVRFTSRKALKKHSGKLTARAKITLPDTTATYTIKISRPRCSR